jgi:FlaA1/EpsC-like NDP-sugar epimerase
VGTSPAAVDLGRELFARRTELGVEIVGFIDPDPSKVGQPLMNPGIIGAIDDIPGIVASRGVDRVVVSLATRGGRCQSSGYSR